MPKRTVLLVEDSPADVLLITRAISRCVPDVEVVTVNDGASALAYLRGEPPYEDAGWVTMVLLDINLPGKSGREVLEEIRADGSIARIPVVVLTSSSLDTEVNGMYDRHASSYHIKPDTPGAFDRLFTTFGDYWFGAVVFPTE